MPGLLERRTDAGARQSNASVRARKRANINCLFPHNMLYPISVCVQGGEFCSNQEMCIVTSCAWCTAPGQSTAITKAAVVATETANARVSC